MTGDNNDLATVLSCDKIVDEWARFGLEGLVILALMVLVGFMLWLQKSERESLMDTMLCMTDALKEANQAVSTNNNQDDGK